MRILVTSTPGMGHVGPLLPIAAALAAVGHDLAWATASDSCEMVERCGFTAIPAGVNASARMAEFLTTTPGFSELAPRARRPVMFGGLFGRVAAPRMREDLVDVFDSFRPDLVVNDLAELAAVPMAITRQIPHVTVAFSGAVPSPVLARAIVEVAGVWTEEGQVVRDDLGLADHLYLHPFPPGFGGSPRGSRVLAVRPVAFAGAAGSDRPDWIDTLGVGRRAVYVTFGTELGARAPWRDVLDALGTLDVDVIATTGSRFDQRVLSPSPPNVRIEEYVPQHQLLDRVAMVVSHAGAGTMLAAAAHGVPQLCLPIAADQFDNADAIEAVGAGLVLEPDELGELGEMIGDGVTRVLGESQFRDAARRLADQLATLPHPTALVPTVEGLVSR